MNKKFYLVVFYILVLSIPTIARAASSDFVNQGSYFTDNISKLDWLPFIQSTYKTYAQVVQATNDPSSELYGYRVASTSEVITLANNYSGTVGQAHPNDFMLMMYSTHSLRGLIGLFGNLYSDYDSWGTNVAYVSDSIEGRHYVLQAFSAPMSEYDYLTYITAYDEDYFDVIPTYLVRNTISSTVPEPRSYGLLLCGMVLVGLCLTFRKAKH
jgi:hypothetical protein